MIIEIRNCNNIDSASIQIFEDKLNIKFAPNGSGKSTIAKALSLSAKIGQNQLQDLTPFKLREKNLENLKPEVNGAESLQNIMCFNEEYVTQFVFRPEELLSNSFDILIRTDAYQKNERDIEDLVSNIKGLVVGNPELDDLIATLKEMGNAFKITRTGLSQASTGMKGLSAGNKIEHIPVGLEAYKPFIQSGSTVNWIDWQTRGYDFVELSESCPFCTADAHDKKHKIKQVGAEYDKNTIKHLVSIIQIIDKLGDYFSPDSQAKLRILTSLKEGLSKEHIDFLVAVKAEIETFTEKLERLKTLSAFHFKDGEKVTEQLPSFKLNLEFFAHLKSAQMISRIGSINSSIDAVIDKAGLLQGKINQQQSEIKKTVNLHQNDINNFLSYAGFRYTVSIVGTGDQSQLKLRHRDHEKHLSGGSQHLSFGERNAFAIVLFMYECLAKKPELIILDDPISSFDKNKKYAILEMLFRRDSKSCLKNKTVLMLTHDIEPIIDTNRSLAHKFSNQTSTSFLRLERGVLQERLIQKNDIQTFSRIFNSILTSDRDDVIKLIYARRHFEILDETGDAYQVISNLLHQRRKPFDSREPQDKDGKYPEMEQSKFAAGCSAISAHLAGFSYSNFLNRLGQASTMRTLYDDATNGYEKLQIFRILKPDAENSVVQKFVNETYHIENELICQLDPSKFDVIPEYIVDECNRILIAT